MRMWGIPANLLCSKHLRGEHFELHILSGVITKQTNPKLLQTLAKNGLLCLRDLAIRHDEIADEMMLRGMNHKSDLWFDWEMYHRSLGLPDSDIDLDKSVYDLFTRCSECTINMYKANFHTMRQLCINSDMDKVCL